MKNEKVHFYGVLGTFDVNFECYLQHFDPPEANFRRYLQHLRSKMELLSAFRASDPSQVLRLSVLLLRLGVAMDSSGD